MQNSQVINKGKVKSILNKLDNKIIFFVQLLCLIFSMSAVLEAFAFVG